MFEATVDKSANLLKIAYTGRVRADEAKACAEQIRVLLRDIQPGFRLLTDFRTLESMDLDCVPFIEKVMDWCDDAGVQKVVRIMPDPHKDIGLNIMSLFHYGRAVRIVTCQTFEDALRALAG